MSIQPLTQSSTRQQVVAKRALELVTQHRAHQLEGAAWGAGLGAGLAKVCAPFGPAGRAGKWPIAVFAVTIGLIGLAVGSADNTQAQLADLQSKGDLWDSGALP